jgi:hypothetical protein
VSKEQPLEHCREWGLPPDAEAGAFELCHKPARLIFWGKLFPKEALGPRCEFHALRHLPDLTDKTLLQWAVFDLKGLARKEEA